MTEVKAGQRFKYVGGEGNDNSWYGFTVVVEQDQLFGEQYTGDQYLKVKREADGLQGLVHYNELVSTTEAKTPTDPSAVTVEDECYYLVIYDDEDLGAGNIVIESQLDALTLETILENNGYTVVLERHRTRTHEWVEIL